MPKKYKTNNILAFKDGHRFNPATVVLGVTKTRDIALLFVERSVSLKSVVGANTSVAILWRKCLNSYQIRSNV